MDFSKKVSKKAGDVVTVYDGYCNLIIRQNGSLEHKDYLSSSNRQFVIVATNVGGLPRGNDTIIQAKETKEVYFIRESGLRFVDRCEDCGEPKGQKCPECGTVKPHTCCR
jgi:rRNA pseudouridine-1189 N-methylase Emg1 (Nep1/Mra1 family)